MNNKISPLILFLFLLVGVVEATRLDIGETTTISGKTMTLVNIGSSGSIILDISGQSKPLIIKQYGIPTLIDGFKIKIKDWKLEPDGTGYMEFELVKKEIKCKSDLDCYDNDVCTVDTCDERTGICSNIGEGCRLNGECLSEGTILDNFKEYCKNNGWFDQKTLKENCDDNYECLSNNCLNNKCIGFLIGEPVKKDFFAKITGYSIFSVNKRSNKKMDWIIFLFGIIMVIKGIFLVITPKQAKKVFSYFSHYTNNFFRVIGIILIVIGFLLIFFYLT